MSEVFISYSHKDKQYVHTLTNELVRRGFSVWIDDRIDYGSRWPHVIQESLDNCKAFIVVMSSQAYSSDWVQNELNRAKEKGKPIFPLLLEGDVWLSVQATQFIDVRGGNQPPEKFYERLSQYTLPSIGRNLDNDAKVSDTEAQSEFTQISAGKILMALLPQLKPSHEAIEHFERAIYLMEAQEEGTETLREQASELALAIHRADGVFSIAHALLGSVYFSLGDAEKGKRELGIAIQQDQYNVLAHSIYVRSEALKYKSRTHGFASTDFVAEIVVLFFIVIGFFRPFHFYRRVTHLVKAYSETIARVSDVNCWLYLSEILLDTCDVVQDAKLSGGKRIAQAILDTQIDRTRFTSEQERRVGDVTRRARGRILLAE